MAIILYIAISEDGFIAREDGSINFLPQPKDEEALVETGYLALLDRIDTILMGRKSYDQILSFGDWGWKDKKTVVFTSSPLNPPLSCVQKSNDTPLEFMIKRSLKNTSKDIWLLGGANLCKSFFDQDLVDEIILTIVPTKINVGIALNIPIEKYHFEQEKKLMDGMIQRTYKRGLIQNTL
jgi:dihydrofolate reductase